MFKPKYLIRLDEKAFSQSKVLCLGSQLRSILENLRELTELLVWFGADVDAVSPIPHKLGIDSFELKKIGDVDAMVNLCKNIDQFLSGVFIAVKEKTQNFKCFELRVGTEDEQFRPLDLDEILIEIRAFDTSYFEIFSEDLILMERLSKTYKIKIEHYQKNYSNFLQL